MRTLRLTLLSHASTQAQRLGRFALDEALDTVSDHQKDAIRMRCRNFTFLTCAPEARSRETAEIISAMVTVDAELADCDFGRWKGLRLDEVQKAEPDLLQVWISDIDSAPHGGESISHVCKRMSGWLESASQKTGHIVAVTHPFLLRAALLHVLQCPVGIFHSVDIQPLTLIDLSFNGKWRLQLPACCGS